MSIQHTQIGRTEEHQGEIQTDSPEAGRGNEEDEAEPGTDSGEDNTDLTLYALCSHILNPLLSSMPSPIPRTSL